jgi:DNA polymerase (family 10)
MTAVPGFGPKKAMVVYRELGIDGLEELVAAARDGRLRGLKGFSAKTEENVLRAVQRAQRDTGRVTIDLAMGVAEALLERLRTIPDVRRADLAGSLRRMADTIGDVDLLVASGSAAPIMDAFTGYEDVEQILARGETKSSVVTRSGLRDLRVIQRGVGRCTIYFTGSKAHNVHEVAVRGLKLNEYGLFDVETDELSPRRPSATSTTTWAAVHRTDVGKIVARSAAPPASSAGRDVGAMRGDLHTHTVHRRRRDPQQMLAAAGASDTPTTP